MRVYLKSSDLASDAGKQLLDLAVRIAADGKLDLGEIKALRAWLRANGSNTEIAAIGYLQDIMNRIAGDGVIDHDELLELHVAIERVIPSAQRTPIVQSRKKRDDAHRERLQEERRLEKEKRQEERLRGQEEYARKMRLRHNFNKVAGVTFPNDDGSERQEIIRRCKTGETLVLRHDPDNAYSDFAVQVLRQNGEQLGHAPEYLAEWICKELSAGYSVVGVICDITGGTKDKPIRGVNFLTAFAATGVTYEELKAYADEAFRADGVRAPCTRVADFSFGSSRAKRPRKPWWKFW